MTLRFSSCALNLDARRLFREGEEVHLSPKAYDMLKVLIESRPGALSKADLLQRVWPQVFVSDASLARVINEIRRAVGESARGGQIIRTVHGFGYAFAADVQEDDTPEHRRSRPPQTLCYLTSPARTFRLREGEQLAGRDPHSDLWLDSPKVSWRHARIVASKGRVTIEDLGSKNGTFVRGSRIDSPAPLGAGDEVRIGRFTFVFRAEEPNGLTETDILPPDTPGRRARGKR